MPDDRDSKHAYKWSALGWIILALFWVYMAFQVGRTYGIHNCG